jgi:hypothetical protein
MRKIDFVGIVLIAAATILILYAANAGGVQAPWDSAQIIGCFVAGSISLVAFVLYEIKYPAVPILPMHLFKIRNVCGVYIFQFFYGLTFFLVLFGVPLFLQLAKGKSALGSVCARHLEGRWSSFLRTGCHPYRLRGLILPGYSAVHGASAPNGSLCRDG